MSDTPTTDAIAAFPPSACCASDPETTPYYEDAQVRLYNGDCTKLLKQMPRTDAVITDPPYNVGLEYGADVDDRKTDYAGWCDSWWKLLNAERVAISCGIANMQIWYEKKPTWWLCWYKPGAMGRCTVGFNNWEPVAMWGRTLKQTCDVFTAPVITDSSLNGHPCPKPLDWAKKQLELLVPEGGTVLDPFAGSGTVLLAAKETGRLAIGIEINKGYCDQAIRRLSQGVLL